ncbi:MAG: GDYXXLXY domain-containing protein [Cyanobacteria bacterium J06607_10]
MTDQGNSTERNSTERNSTQEATTSPQTPAIGRPVQPLSPLPSTLPKPTPNRRTPIWRFLTAMVFQSALIVAIPFQSALTYANGQTVTLQTAPVDPYDLLRGYSQTLRFDISNRQTLENLPGASDVFVSKNQGAPIYVTLAAPSTAAPSQSNAPTAWTPVAVSIERPASLADDQIALQGRYNGWRDISYGLETYYMPEAQRDDINEHIRQVNREDAESFVVDIKVDSQGNSVPLSLWVQEKEYRF